MIIWVIERVSIILISPGSTTDSSYHGAFGLNYNELCHSILELDRSIRFAAIASLEGKIFAAEYSKNVNPPLLTREESELSIMQSLIRMNTRKTLESKLGKTLYATAVYEKIKRATISLFIDGKCDFYLMVSFEKNADHERIITTKILPSLAIMAK